MPIDLPCLGSATKRWEFSDNSGGQVVGGKMGKTRSLTALPRDLRTAREASSGLRKALLILTLEMVTIGTLAAVPDLSSDESFERPCYGSNLAGCLGAQTELQSVAGDCRAGGRRVCLVPLGKISSDLVQRLIEHFDERYGLDVKVLTPIAVPEALIDRDGMQFEGSELIDYMSSQFADASADPQAVLIGMTPVDIYTDEEDWRFVFGIRGTYADPKGVISTFRMNPETYLKPEANDLLFERPSKMLSRYVGQLFFGLMLNEDPQSPLYHTILGLRDLDRIDKPLLVPTPP